MFALYRGSSWENLRVVNALLTQLDQIKRAPNVLILTTSNITGAIDGAFVDRFVFKDVRRNKDIFGQGGYCTVHRSS